MRKDLTGQKFGRLTVVAAGEDYVNPNTGKRRARWLCKCECGGTALVQGGTLISGKTTSCGCYSREVHADLCRARNGPGKDISGMRFGRLVAVEPHESTPGCGVAWSCICDCGNVIQVFVKDLTSGNTKSCGCLRNEKISGVNLSHGESHTRLYNVWNGMRQRCNDPSHKSYHNYGGRGIRVCEEWGNYASFKKWAVSAGYDVNAEYGDCTIDRIDVNGNYEPSNCRWVDLAEQAKNKRKNMDV